MEFAYFLTSTQDRIINYKGKSCKMNEFEEHMLVRSNYIMEKVYCTKRMAGSAEPQTYLGFGSEEG